MIEALLLEANARCSTLGQDSNGLWGATVWNWSRGQRSLEQSAGFGMSSAQPSALKAIEVAIEAMKNYGWKPKPKTPILDLEINLEDLL